MIIGDNLPNIPWQERLAGNKEIVWRYSRNPIVKRDQIPGSNSIFNSAVIAKDGHFVGIFRSDNMAMEQHLFLAKSSDAIHWDIEPTPMPLYGKDDEQVGVACGYDPRVCRIDKRYYVTLGSHNKAVESPVFHIRALAQIHIAKRCMPVVGRPGKHHVFAVDFARKKHAVAVKWQEGIFQLIEFFKIIGVCHPDRRTVIIVAPGHIVPLIDTADTGIN